MLVIILTGGITWGCSERTLDDDAAAVCAAACERDRRCGRAPEGERLDACVQTCIPGIKKSRMSCEALFDLDRCASTLSCEDLLSYEDIIMQLDLELARTAIYPCNQENIAYLNECLNER